MANPLMLITLGVAVARLHPSDFLHPLFLGLAKVVVCTAIGWGVGRAFGLSPVAFAVLVLQAGTPVAVTSYLLAEKCNVEAAKVASLVVVSTLLSVITIPLTLAAFL